MSLLVLLQSSRVDYTLLFVHTLSLRFRIGRRRAGRHADSRGGGDEQGQESSNGQSGIDPPRRGIVGLQDCLVSQV